MKNFSFINISFPKLTLAHLFVALASLCKAIKDTLAFHYGSSIFKNLNAQFWNPDISWLNKYADYPSNDSAAFFLSKTALVFLTDGWHLFDFLMLIFLFLAVQKGGNFIYSLLIYAVVFNTAYYLFY